MARTKPMRHTKPMSYTPSAPHDPCAPAPDVPMNCGDFLDDGSDVIATNEGTECDPCAIRLNFKPVLDESCWA